MKSVYIIILNASCMDSPDIYAVGDKLSDFDSDVNLQNYKKNPPKDPYGYHYWVEEWSLGSNSNQIRSFSYLDVEENG